MFEDFTAVLSEAWAKLREWAILAGKGRLLLSGSVVLASLKAAVVRTFGWFFISSTLVASGLRFRTPSERGRQVLKF